jgi:opacity protein-like surface antigen
MGGAANSRVLRGKTMRIALLPLNSNGAVAICAVGEDCASSFRPAAPMRYAGCIGLEGKKRGVMDVIHRSRKQSTCRADWFVMAAVASMALTTTLLAGQTGANNETAAELAEAEAPLLIAAGTSIADYDGTHSPAVAEPEGADDAYVSELGLPEVDGEPLLGTSCCEPGAASCCDARSAPRLYVGGIIGASFATLALPPDDTINRSLFTAGGTLGVAFDRPLGALRLEVEGRGRDKVSETVVDSDLNFSITGEATDIWSATVNVWRDFAPTDTVGVYLGGGIGGGGYRSVIAASEPFPDLISANDPTSAFAWQAGCGLTYAIGPRATLDLGYRFFAIDETTAQGFDTLNGPFSYRTGFSASELLFTLRVYEPFSSWW